jgi:DNA modification methylase
MIEVNIKQVKANPNNPRIIKDAKFQKLVKSIQEFPDMLNKRPLIVFTDVDGKYCVLGGNMRLKALNELKYDTVPIVLADEWTEEQKAEFLIKDNVGFGEWDWDQLANEWDAEKLDEWGLDLPIDLHVEELEAEEDNYEIPNEITTDIVLGDLYEIGEHRLLCGDSTDSDQVAKLMNGQKADMVFTDPPYKVETNGGQNGDIGKALRNQGKDIEFISEFNPIEFLQVLPIVFGKNMNAYIFCNNELLPEYLAWAKDAGYSFNVLIWKKPNAIPINSAHRPDIEYILLFRKSSIWNYGLKDVNYSRCLEYGREKGLHPTMKPIELIANEMQISSNKNSLVFDFFLGSGSTMVASHQLKRKCYGMELDPKYCQVIIDRMKKLDPSLEIKRNGELIK